MKERDPEAADLLGRVRVVGDHHGHVDRQFTAPVPPQQVEQAVIGFGGEDRDAFRHRHIAEPELQAESLRERRAEVFPDAGQDRLQVIQGEDGPLEEGTAVRIVGVLVERDDVRAETVLDLADAARTFDDAYGWLTRATGRELVSVPQLRAALAARTRVRWRGLLAEALAEAQDGAMSPLERRYVRDVERAHGLPPAHPQARRELAGGVRFLDNYHARFRLCVELDGRTSHPPEQKWADAGRDNDNLFRDDVATIRFGLLDVTTRRCNQAARLASLFLRRGWDGAGLRPCGPQCPVGRLLSNHRVHLMVVFRDQLHTITKKLSAGLDGSAGSCWWR